MQEDLPPTVDVQFGTHPIYSVETNVVIYKPNKDSHAARQTSMPEDSTTSTMKENKKGKKLTNKIRITTNWIDHFKRIEDDEETKGHEGSVNTIKTVLSTPLIWGRINSMP